jgi:two-component system phosphate regulon sensor histidine kinase PhoR
VIWDRWRKTAGSASDQQPLKPFEDLIEEAPAMALLLDRDQRIVAANEAARRFFDIEPGRLPASLVEVTLEGNLVSVLRAGTPEGETQLVHRRRTVRTKLVPGPRPGETLMFLTDVTELRRLERVRQEFVANLVHELKTPITSLRLTAESLLGAPAPKDRARFAERLVREADLMSRIVDNLRQLAELDSGARTVETSSFHLAELMHELRLRLDPERPVNVDVPEDLIIATDRPKLAQALGNLIDNAAKFSPHESPIDISAEVLEQVVRISVRDHGAGISPEHWNRLFERFYKVDRARPREAGGFGLGLAISKHLVQAIGGRIWTEAADEGGQVFFIALPPDALTGT